MHETFIVHRIYQAKNRSPLALHCNVMSSIRHLLATAVALKGERQGSLIPRLYSPKAIPGQVSAHDMTRNKATMKTSIGQNAITEQLFLGSLNVDNNARNAHNNRQLIDR